MLTEFLRGVDAFGGLDAPMLAQLASALVERRYPAGTRILARGEPGDAMFVLRRGRVRVPVTDADGLTRIEAGLGPGDVFGEMALMTGDPRSADVFADTDTDVLVLEARHFLSLIAQAPGMAEFLTRLLATRMADGDMRAKRIGKYHIVREIGRGGMALVFEGVHADLGTRVAVKMLSHRLSMDPAFAQVFQREARIIAGLRHPNIVQVYDAEVAYATYFIVMEHVDGSPVDRLIAEQGPLPPELVRRVLTATARALHYAHGRGVVHRDVKPSNVFVAPEGDVRLMDFGVAFVRHEGHQAGVTVGTPQYMAPEQCFGEAPDGRSDLYALGMTAFHMLAGRVAFAGTPIEVMKAQVAQPLPSLLDWSPGCPADLVAWVARCTAKDPGQRFQTAADAAEALERRSAKLPPPAPPPDPPRIKVLSLAYPASEEPRVCQALAELQLLLGHSAGAVRIGLSDLTAPADWWRPPPEG